MGKCPKCGESFASTRNGYKSFCKHYKVKHVPKQYHAKEKVYKEPAFVKLMKKRGK